LRRGWHEVVLHFRGDCGFGVPAMYEVCEALRVPYTFGLSVNAVLQRETEGLLAEAVAAYERERQAARQQEPPRPAVPARLFTGFWYQAGTWSQPRLVVAQAEANDRGTSPRFVVADRTGAVLFAEPTCDEYAGRGESEIHQADYPSNNILYRAEPTCYLGGQGAARLNGLGEATARRSDHVRVGEPSRPAAEPILLERAP